MDQEAFGLLVREALDHLSSRSYLAAHRLAILLGGGQHPVSGDTLRRRLLDAIEQLRPVGGPESSPPDWRRYRHLMMRYVEGLSRDRVAASLGVSLRQASRDHERGVDAVASLLWMGLTYRGDARHEEEPPEPDPPEPCDVTSLSEEMNRVFVAEGNWADLSETAKGAVATLSTLLTERSVSCAVRIPDTLPRVAVARTILRQVLLTLLSYVVELARGADVELYGVDSPRGVLLTIDVRGRVGESSRSGETRHRIPTPSIKARELLESAEKLLGLQGGLVERGTRYEHEPFLTVVLPPVALHHVLVVDDNPDMVGLFRRYLRGQPYRLIQATSAERAIQLAEETRPSAVILDVMLPSADGWEVLAELRRRNDDRHIPIVVCSILPEKALAESLGANEFLAKPVTRDALLTALRRCVPDPDRSGLP